MTIEEKDAIFSSVEGFTMTDRVRVDELVDQVGRVIYREVPGAFVECGVWRGGSMMAVALTLLHLGISDRDLYLFDTFEGMSRPEPVDVDLYGESALMVFIKQQYSDDRADWCRAPLEDVQLNMRTTGYPQDRVHYVVGKVEDTLPVYLESCREPLRIALLRLDTDFYSSTKHELIHLFPLLSPGGAIIIDDYGHWDGSRKATDEYLQEHGITSPLVMHGYTAATIVKGQR